MSVPIEIAAVRPEELPAAVELALSNVPAEGRDERILNTLVLISSGDIDPGGLFVARRQGRMCGVFVCIPLPGASGLVWLPRWVDPHPTDNEQQALIATGLDWLRRRGCRLAQLIVPPEHEADQAPFWQAGFRSAGPLLTLRHDLSSPPKVPQRPGWRLRSSVEVADERLGELVARTYEGTLDFPEMSGTRTMREVLTGHRAAGRHRADDWWIGFEGSEPAAVLLLTEMEPLGAWDLTYLGVAPEQRRRGWGAWLIAEALRKVADAGGDQLEVGVDARNAPALQLYASGGFRVVDRRAVSLLFFRNAEIDGIPTAAAASAPIESS